jgi:hypothetical protein
MANDDPFLEVFVALGDLAVVATHVSAGRH